MKTFRNAALPVVASPSSASDLSHDELLAPLRGPSPAIARLWSQVRLIAPHFRKLMLQGEPGCGQESVVHLLQTLSPFQAGPLLTLAPREAARRLQSPKRLLQSVAGGVLYLPEVDTLPAEAQADLLRFLRLNRHHLCALITSSEHDLRTLAAAKGYSAPLGETLASFSLAVPALRDRQEDIPLLAELLLREAEASMGQGTSMRSLTQGFLQELIATSWPGNVDQLRSILKLLVDMPGAHHPREEVPESLVLEARDLQRALKELSSQATATENPPAVRMIKLDQVIQEHIRSVLVACQGNKLKASETLGISRSTLYRMLDATSAGSLALIA